MIPRLICCALTLFMLACEQPTAPSGEQPSKQGVDAAKPTLESAKRILAEGDPERALTMFERLQKTDEWDAWIGLAEALHASQDTEALANLYQSRDLTRIPEHVIQRAVLFGAQLPKTAELDGFFKRVCESDPLIAKPCVRYSLKRTNCTSGCDSSFEVDIYPTAYPVVKAEINGKTFAMGIHSGSPVLFKETADALSSTPSKTFTTQHDTVDLKTRYHVANVKLGEATIDAVAFIETDESDPLIAGWLSLDELFGDRDVELDWTRYKLVVGALKDAPDVTWNKMKMAKLEDDWIIWGRFGEQTLPMRVGLGSRTNFVSRAYLDSATLGTARQTSGMCAGEHCVLELVHLEGNTIAFGSDENELKDPIIVMPVPKIERLLNLGFQIENSLFTLKRVRFLPRLREIWVESEIRLVPIKKGDTVTYVLSGSRIQGPATVREQVVDAQSDFVQMAQTVETPETSIQFAVMIPEDVGGRLSWHQHREVQTAFMKTEKGTEQIPIEQYKDAFKPIALLFRERAAQFQGLADWEIDGERVACFEMRGRVQYGPSDFGTLERVHCFQRIWPWVFTRISKDEETLFEMRIEGAKPLDGTIGK